MQLRPAVLLAALTLLPGLPHAQETTAESPQPNVEADGAHAVPSLLTKAFKDVLKPDQVATIAADSTPESLVGLMLAEQKDAARSKLKELEEADPKPAELEEIERGYRLLGATADMFRVGMRRQGLIANDSREITNSAQTAYEEGRTDDALRLAAEALARNPEDKQAFAILMLAKPTLQAKKLNLPDPFGGKDPGGDGSVYAGGADQVAAAEREPTPQALSIMKQVVIARRARDMDQTLRLALDAMRADPTSSHVQQLYTVVIEDRAKQMRRMRQTVGFLEQAVDAERAGNRERAIALAEQAAAADPHPLLLQFVQDLRSRPAKAAPGPQPKPNRAPSGVPPAVPIGAGGLLLAAGALAWRFGGRDWADAWWKDAKASMAVGGFVLGTAAIVYGGGLMLGAVSMTPTLSLSGGGTLAGAIAIDGAAAAKGVAVTVAGGKLANDGVSYAKSQSQSNSGTGQGQQNRPSSSLKKPSAKDPEFQNLIDDLFQPQDRLPGGTAGAARNEIRTGQATANTFHSKKAEQYVRAIDNLLRRRSMGRGPRLDPVDQATAEAIRADLQNAVNLAKVGKP